MEDENVLSEVDIDSSVDEERVRALGISKKMRILLVVYCERLKNNDEEELRIISARRATNKEKKIYEKGI